MKLTVKPGAFKVVNGIRYTLDAQGRWEGGVLGGTVYTVRQPAAGYVWSDGATSYRQFERAAEKCQARKRRDYEYSKVMVEAYEAAMEKQS